MSFKVRIFVNTSTSVDPNILRFLRIFSSKGLKNGLVFFSSPSCDGTVNKFFLRVFLTSSLLLIRSRFLGSMDKAKEALFSVYSWPEQIFVVSGNPIKRDRLPTFAQRYPQIICRNPKPSNYRQKKGYSVPEYIVLYDL